METTHKEFKPFNKVIFRPKDESYMWICGLFSNYDGKGANIIGHENVLSFDEYDILPYEGNEHLVGTTDEPEEVIEVKEGELCFFTDDILDDPDLWVYGKLRNVCEGKFHISVTGWTFAVKFAHFNPYDMEETKKHILWVKNGKVVKYKG